MAHSDYHKKKIGNHQLHPETLITTILPEWGINSHDIDDGLSSQDIHDALESAASKGPVRICYIETPANPTNSLFDFAALYAEIQAFDARHGYRPVIVCDNTLLGPIFQQPLRHGVDLCVYSLTKYVGGHSDLVAGGVTGSQIARFPVYQCAATVQVGG